MSSKGRLVLWLSDVLAQSRAWYYCYRIPRPLVDRLLPKINILYSSGLCIFCNLGRCDVMCRNRRRSLCEIPAREVHVVGYDRVVDEPERAIETYSTDSSSRQRGSWEERLIRCRCCDRSVGTILKVVPSPSTRTPRRHRCRQQNHHRHHLRQHHHHHHHHHRHPGLLRYQQSSAILVTLWKTT